MHMTFNHSNVGSNPANPNINMIFKLEISLNNLFIDIYIL